MAVAGCGLLSRNVTVPSWACAHGRRQISAPLGKERKGFCALLEGDDRARTFAAALAWQAPACRPAVPGTAKVLIVAYRGARGRTSRAAWELTWLMILCSSFA